MEQYNINKESCFPLSRIRTIMKSSLETGQITNEVLLLMAKTTEMFVKHLTKESFVTTEGNTLLYKHLAMNVQEKGNLEFLLQIIPQRIKIHSFKQIMDEVDARYSSAESDEDKYDNL